MAEPSTILSSELEETNGGNSNGYGTEPRGPLPPLKKMIIIAVAVIGVLALAAVIFLQMRKAKTAKPAVENTPVEIATTTGTALPDFSQIGTSTVATTTAFSDLAVEYLSFADFYSAPVSETTSGLKDYELPLNVKIEAMNYYDVSRKLNLDPGLEALNKDGLALLDNPWPQEAPDFYSLYANLASKQVPPFLTADFLAYYYQNTLKKTFKDIEENVFYNNLWDINRELYDAARARYEARLAAIGDVNDSLLEGERLEMAFFAVALELLKPQAAQISGGSLGEQDKFAVTEADRFYFVTPPYLRDDVLAEVALIRAGKETIKSPVKLYVRDYKDFSVPADYRSNAKLNNFYLTTKWLNSVFPLNYRAKDCADCLLDKEDWRINMTAAAFIAHDFSSLPDLKNKWARIYKVMAFFKGLREDLSYVDYRDALTSVFGAEYDVAALFGDDNSEAAANLEKLRSHLAAAELPEIAGALPKTDSAFNKSLGLKVMAESYSPNDYIFRRLTAPAVGEYLASSTTLTNITSCAVTNKKIINRCGGLALDAINLVHPVGDNPYFLENTNYAGYTTAVDNLRAELNQAKIWRINDYWFNLSLAKVYLEAAKSGQPLFTRTVPWREREMKTAVGAWINWQLPLDSLIAKQAKSDQGLGNSVAVGDYAYIEPNLPLINELLAENEMLVKMFTALQLDKEVSLVLQNLRTVSSDLTALKQIVVKELSGEELSAADNRLVATFVGQYQAKDYKAEDRQIVLRAPQQKNGWKDNLSRLKLLAIVHQEGAKKVISVGPVWDYQESR